MDEDNNPFAGSTHLFAGGLSGYEDHLHGGFHQDIFTPSVEQPLMAGPALEEQNEEEQQEEIGQGFEQEDDEEEEEFTQSTYIEPMSSNYHSQHNQTDAPIHITEGTIANGTVLYTISYQTSDGGNLVVHRRYSEFASLRLVLGRLLPTVVIPPLPHKHTLAEYLLNPFNAKTDPHIISSRKRLLTSFLQRCYSIPDIARNAVWEHFLDPHMSWSEVINSPPISLLPSSNLLAPPLNPTKPSPLHLLLPIPQTYHSNGSHIDNTFHEHQQKLTNYKSTTSALGKIVKKTNRHFGGLVRDLGQLGALYNAFSLENDNNEPVSLAIEKTGQAIDISYLNSEALAFKLLVELKEPIAEIKENCRTSIEKVLVFHKLKTLQLHIIQSTIKIREDKIKALKNLQYQSDRLEEVLSKSNANVQSDSINSTVSNLQQGQSLSKISSPWLKLFHSGNTKTNDISKLNAIQRTEEVNKIENELVKLNDCLRIVQKDIEQINKAIEGNLEELFAFFGNKWDQVIKNYIRSLMIYLTENLKAWEEAKSVIDEI